MNPSRRRALAAIGAAGLGASCLLSPGRQALAQKPWPERPINYIVPFPPGGLTDVAARQVGKALGDAERWNVVVETSRAAPPTSARPTYRTPRPTAIPGWLSRCRTRPTPRCSPAAPATT